MRRDYQAITNMDELDALVEKLSSDGLLLSLDMETSYSTKEAVDKRALDVYHPDFFVVGFSITNDPKWSRYIPLRHDGETYFEPRIVWEKFRPILENLPLLAHNMQFEGRILGQLHNMGDADGPIVPGVIHDTMLMSHVTGKHKYHGLKALSREVLDVDQQEFHTLFAGMVDAKGKPVSKAKARFSQLGVTPAVVNYACDDTALCLELMPLLMDQMDDRQKRLYGIEMEICRMMIEAAHFGVGVDWDGLRVAHSQYNGFRSTFDSYVREKFAAKTADPDVQEFARTANFGSSQQMRKLLYDDLGFTTTRTTGTGALSTDAIALEALSRKEPAVRALLSLREIDHLGRRCDKWLNEYAEARDSRVHPVFSQSRVVSGRFAADSPALQQCVSGDTEVLTRNGWVRFDELEDGVEIAQYDPDQERDVTFVVPEVVRKHHKGEVVSIRTYGQEFLFTPEHRILSFALCDTPYGRVPDEQHVTTAAEWAADPERFDEHFMIRVMVPEEEDQYPIGDEDDDLYGRFEFGTAGGPGGYTVTTLPWDDMVYCVQVPTSFFVIRKGDVALVTGNCPKHWLWSVDFDENGKYVAKGVNGDRHWEGNFRKFIVAAPGKYLCTFDYSQVELRVLAGITKEPSLLKSFATGSDPHVNTASLMLGIPIDEVDKKTRQLGKLLNFSVLYGAGAKRVADQLAIEVEEAESLLGKYKAQFTHIAKWDEYQRAQGVANKHVRTWLGRYVPLWDASSENSYIRSGAERLAVNSQIQGGAADYVKLAMLRSRAMLKRAGLWHPDKVMLTMNQHDSLTFECDNSVDPNELRDILNKAVVFDVKEMLPNNEGLPDFPEFEVDWELGRTWGGSAGWDNDTRAVWVEEAQTWVVEGTEPEPLPQRAPEALQDTYTPEPVQQPSQPLLSLVPDVPDEALAPITGLRLHMDHLPAKEGMTRFVALLKHTPGDHTIDLVVGDREPVRLQARTALSVDAGERLSLACGVRVRVEGVSQTDVPTLKVV